MIQHRNLALCAILGALLGCSTSPDVERSQLREGLRDAESLAKEVEGWRGELDANPPGTVVESITGFQNRADAILDQITDVSDEAKAGLDLAGVRQALNQMIEFPTDRFGDASPTARASLVEQFAGLAGNLRGAVQSVQVRMG